MNVYMVVTNDIYELPVALDLMGVDEVAKFLGMNANQVRQKLCRDSFGKSKYKAVVIGQCTHRRIKKEKKNRDRSGYYAAYYQRNRERKKAYYEDRKKMRCSTK